MHTMHSYRLKQFIKKIVTIVVEYEGKVGGDATWALGAWILDYFGRIILHE